MPRIPSPISADDLASLIEREHFTVELKTGTGRRPLQAAFVAMSNTEGGSVVIGVDDDRRVLGRRRTQGTEDDIYGAASDASNVGRLAVYEVEVAGATVVVVDVDERTDDVAATSDGRVLVRRGGRNQPLGPRDIAELYRRRMHVRFEATDSGVPPPALESLFVADVANAYGWRSRDRMQDRWLERGLLHESGNLTVAGALMLTDPAATLGTAKFRVDIRRYEADHGTNYVNREIVDGPLYEQVDHATETLMLLVGTEIVITGARRHDVPRLPRRVVREVVANAVAHRTYEADASPIVIEVRPGAVTVTSPGALPEPVTVKTLRQSQAPRNHTVIDILRRFGLAEDSGQGIDVIEDGMRLELLAEPVFEASADSFTVRLPLQGSVSSTERGWLAEFERTGSLRREERALLLAVAREGSVTNQQARDALGIDSTEARTRIRRLRDAGILVQHGTRGRAYYTLGTLGPDRTDSQIVLAAAEDGPVTNEMVRALTGLDRVPARLLLARLVVEGQLLQRGERRGTFYERPR